jgi:hypothetical protein
LIERIVRIASDPNSIILDSFAGSGTTAHAVLAANKKDGGDRKFILVECEDYADTLTAERVRRVIEGYAYTGTQREELLKQSITFTDLRRANRLLEQIDSIENLDGHRFDRIDKKVKDGVLTVEGVKAVQQQAEGLGGSFTYCTLGAAVDMDKLLTGEQLAGLSPNWARCCSTPPPARRWIRPQRRPLRMRRGWAIWANRAALHVWLIYRPELAFLQSREAALTLDQGAHVGRGQTGQAASGVRARPSSCRRSCWTTSASRLNSPRCRGRCTGWSAAEMALRELEYQGRVLARLDDYLTELAGWKTKADKIEAANAGETDPDLIRPVLGLCAQDLGSPAGRRASCPRRGPTFSYSPRQDGAGPAGAQCGVQGAHRGRKDLFGGGGALEDLSAAIWAGKPGLCCGSCPTRPSMHRPRSNLSDRQHPFRQTAGCAVGPAGQGAGERAPR